MTLIDMRAAELADRMPTGLLARIVAHLNPLRVIVFGSQASGRTHIDSDWDLLVVVDDDIPAERIDWRGIHEARRGMYVPIDLIPCRASTFRERENVIGSLPWIARTKGVTVYERACR